MECIVLTSVKKTKLAALFNPGEVVRDNLALNATISAYHFRLVHWHQPSLALHFIQARAFYVPSSSIFHTTFSKVNRSSLSTSLTAHFFVINLLCHSSLFICSTCPHQLSTFFFIVTVTSSLVSTILCISTLWIRSAKLTPHILQRDRFFTAFTFLSFFFCKSHVLLYNSVGTNIVHGQMFTCVDVSPSHHCS